MEATFSDAAIKFVEVALEELESGEGFANAVALAESACKLAGISRMMADVQKREQKE